mmetsp:Transcript_139386/g.445779  ORF Transcript_139386/g.445779 Transcript_139386/m.445779 type:complete len:296 (+) Transcript_139386:192-1079(+)
MSSAGAAAATPRQAAAAALLVQPSERSLLLVAHSGLLWPKHSCTPRGLDRLFHRRRGRPRAAAAGRGRRTAGGRGSDAHSLLATEVVVLLVVAVVTLPILGRGPLEVAAAAADLAVPGTHLEPVGSLVGPELAALLTPVVGAHVRRAADADPIGDVGVFAASLEVLLLVPVHDNRARIAAGLALADVFREGLLPAAHASSTHGRPNGRPLDSGSCARGSTSKTAHGNATTRPGMPGAAPSGRRRPRGGGGTLQHPGSVLHGQIATRPRATSPPARPTPPASRRDPGAQMRARAHS